MLGSLIETRDLLTLTGYQKPADAARCLRKQGIKIFEGKDGPWTTLALINAAGGLGEFATQTPYKADEIF